MAASSRIVNYLGITMRVYRSLTLISDDDKNGPTEVRDNILAYFWSPDGDKLAYVTLSGVRGALRWMLFDLSDGSRRPLVDFIPSRDQLTMFQFFDQYAYSHSVWSPDSGSLVFAGELATQAATASSGAHPGHEGSHIFVMDTRFNAPATLASGILGFWSPR